jgi:phospholipase/carboxylesterase
MPKLLEHIEVITKPQPNASIVWLHGLGADGHDFEPIVSEILRPQERAWRFIFPHAPVRPVAINNGLPMRAWYDIKGLDRNAEQDIAGFQETNTAVCALIAREIERGIGANRIVLAGFSQGGAITLYTGLRYAQTLAGLMVLSSYLPLPDRLLAERNAANVKTPIFMAHGTQDPMLPVAMGMQSRDFLQANGHGVAWHEYPMGHSVCAEEVADIRHYLLRVLP